MTMSLYMKLTDENNRLNMQQNDVSPAELLLSEATV